MTLAWIGRIGLYLTFLALVAGIIDQLRARKTQRPGHLVWCIVVAAIGIATAVGAMQVALVTHDFHLAYVAENNATFTPVLYSITGMWSALEGSMLLWVTLLVGITVAVTVRYRTRRDDAVVQWALVVLMGVTLFFTLLMVGPADPFLLNPAHVVQGAGPNALLQDNPLVAIHPPLLYLGFTGFTVPFAFAVAMLITGRTSENWSLEQRRWTILAWGALSVGIVLGAWWSYQVLGWGGFWGWDPVENAALLPWLTGTAYIHSVIVEDRRGLFRVWNLSLAVATFALTVLGTFFTRSGVLQSVHAFSSSTLGPLLIGMFVVTSGGGLALIAWRGDQLRSSVGVDRAMSREGLFVINNVVFVGFAVVVLLGTVFPLLYQAVNGGQVTVGAPYFNKVAAPLAVILLLLMALAPLVPWRSAQREVVWARVRTSAWFAVGATLLAELLGVRHVAVLVAIFFGVVAIGAAFRVLFGIVLAAYRKGNISEALRAPSVGGMVTHVGVVILTVGIVVSTSYVARREVTLAPHQAQVVSGVRIAYDGISVSDSALKQVELVRTTVNGRLLTPAVTTFHGTNGTTVGTPAIDSNLLRDVYLTFDAVGSATPNSGAQVAQNVPTNAVVLGVTVEPLLAWLWVGGLIVGCGAYLSFGRRRHGDAG